MTFYGPISFDETGKNVAKPMGAVQVQNGQINVIAPAPAKVSDIIYPLTPWGERGDGMAEAGSDGDMMEAMSCDSGNTIKIGAAVSESGKYAREGSDVRQGYDMWADFVNNTYGGIKVQGECYSVEIVYYDDESDPDTGANLTEKLISEDE
ncbi:MAG: ABC transporter substrate-binding protein, partial [Methylococcales bacterium]|nr:ABC transporter substrate-binding protein [Methylococcales bacterium]